MKPGIKEISDITGFSPATVSNALNKKKGVNIKTSNKILKTAQEIGYINNNEISKIELVIYKKTGLIIDDTPFFNLLINGIEQECRKSGFDMSIVNLEAFSENYEKNAKEIINNYETAIILLGTELAAEDLEIFKSSHFPILLLDYWDTNMEFSSIIINNKDSARKAVKNFYNNGHTEIGYLKGDFRIFNFQQREKGYKEALKEFGLKYDPEYSITLEATMDGSNKDMKKYLEDNPKLPTAFFADNDMIALGAMKALQECGYKIPDDISIIGLDDLPFSEISTPRLTSLRVPKAEMGQIAVKKMIDIINDEENAITKTQVCTDFIERDSVKKRN